MARGEATRPGPVATARARRARAWGRRRDALFVLPWLVGFGLWSAGPLLANLALSLLHWDLISAPRFAGLAHYRAMLHDPLAWTALGNSLYLALVGVPLSLGLALAIALGLWRLRPDRAHLLRTLFYLPSQIPAAAGAVLWLWIFNPDFGLANRLLALARLPGLLWLLSPLTSKPTLILVGFWGVGTGVLLFSAALGAVPGEVLEAAALDGAGPAARVRHVVLPLISPVILFAAVMGLVGTLQSGFTQVYVMTGGGPDNSTLTLPLYLYRVGWEHFHMGYASALSWLFFAASAAAALLLFLAGRGHVHYEGGLGG